ncbi:MAG: hypothetical protein FJ028_09570 [Chloroflexi bacterium]|nr:hypothetical protein [Chloroflexota bacterium]
MRIRAELEHPAQGIASAFLRALADDDAIGMFSRLSRETRGLLEGLHAARSGTALHEPASGLADVVAPLRASALAALGGAERTLRFGVSGARLVDRGTAYVLLLPDVEREGLLSEDDWRPAHLVALVHESREWLVDIARTAQLSAEAGLPDPLGPIR